MPTSVRSGKSTPGRHDHNSDGKDDDDVCDDVNDDDDDDDKDFDDGQAPFPPPRQPRRSQHLVVRPAQRKRKITRHQGQVKIQVTQVDPVDE